ncbi:MAG TPA: hypothetical protein VEF04_00820, partial [Blastocatellia bacterium]|nr:hypothetical protein [Blastocatellia bacterium]
MPLSENARRILSNLPVAQNFVEPPGYEQALQAKQAEIAKKLFDAQKVQQEAVAKEREMTPARFIFGQSPEKTERVLHGIFKQPESYPVEDLLSGNLNTIQGQIDSHKQDILSDQATYGDATVWEYKDISIARENLNKPAVAESKEKEQLAKEGR